ncbi:hypothetical protein VNO77_09080 [Canavalia gladiata]|uniref:Uncharacterized protein n=1 Tax=Canavalia gladiata TaxID=3824 RepID=A0AAN9MEC5_CANGL
MMHCSGTLNEAGSWDLVRIVGPLHGTLLHPRAEVLRSNVRLLLHKSFYLLTGSDEVSGGIEHKGRVSNLTISRENIHESKLVCPTTVRTHHEGLGQSSPDHSMTFVIAIAHQIAPRLTPES